MKIGILVLFISNFGKRGLYNSQEIGMAKAFADKGHQVMVYKCVASREEKINETIYNNVTYLCQPVKKIGNNTISDFKWLDESLDMLVCFSDVQLLVKKVYRWAKETRTAFVPYVGITESLSESRIVRLLSNLNARHVMNLYKKVPVFVKTNAVKNKMMELGIKNVIVVPVGLDTDLVRSDYKTISQAEAKKILHLDPDAKYLLMVGRIVKGRCPLDCVETFERVHSKSKDYRLLIVGKGPLKDQLFAALKKKNLDKYTDYIESIPNNDMWKAYRAAEGLISFNKDEIFGMAILEAMYYETAVYVIHAPGPNDIIENNVSGYLVHSPQEMADVILRDKDIDSVRKRAHMRIMDNFLWARSVDIIEHNYK